MLISGVLELRSIRGQVNSRLRSISGSWNLLMSLMWRMKRQSKMHCLVSAPREIARKSVLQFCLA